MLIDQVSIVDIFYTKRQYMVVVMMLAKHEFCNEKRFEKVACFRKKDCKHCSSKKCSAEQDVINKKNNSDKQEEYKWKL